MIAARSTYVVAVDSNDFSSTYGQPADQIIGFNGPADSNGDDDVQLGFRYPSGLV